MSDRWRGRRVLVTGGTGFIGGWLARSLLDAGARVTVLACERDPEAMFFRDGVWREAEVVDGRLEDLACLRRVMGGGPGGPVEAVFHLGAQTQVQDALRDPLETFESNIRGTYTLLEACRERADGLKAVVVASSDKAYGALTSEAYAEDEPLQGRYPYDVSKSCADLLTAACHHTYGLPTGVARCGNVYGGGDLNWDRLVPGTIRSLLGGERPVIRSDGTYRRDYVHVLDAVDAYLALAQAVEDGPGRGQAFNFGPDAPHSVLQVVDALAGIMGRPDLTPDVRDEARREIVHQHLDSARARRVLGWRPARDLQAGLADTVAWYRERYSGPDGFQPFQGRNQADKGES